MIYVIDNNICSEEARKQSEQLREAGLDFKLATPEECFFRNRLETVCENMGLDQAIMFDIRDDVYDDLSENELLENYIDGTITTTIKQFTENIE